MDCRSEERKERKKERENKDKMTRREEGCKREITRLGEREREREREREKKNWEGY